MASKKTTRRALFMSVISLLLCCSMLVGATFAWFTDEVTSANNIIKSGNLDIELYHKDVDAADDAYAVVGEENLFDDVLWEPGHVEAVNLKIENKGTLALKYQFNVSVINETGSINQAGNPFKLSDYIQFAIIEDNFKGSRADAVAAAENAGPVAVNGLNWSVPGTMEAGEKAVAKYVTLVVWMPETVGNAANYQTGSAAPTITLGLNLYATQVENESDSFGSDYDKGAAWTGDVNTDWYFGTIANDPDATEFTISSAEELAGLAALVNGTATAPVTTFAAEAPATAHDDFAEKIVKLSANVDLRDVSWTPIGRIGTTSTDFTYAFKGTFDGQNHVVSGLNVSNSGWAGLFGLAHKADIKNVKISDVSIYSNRMAGSLVGQLYGSIDNCHVTGATIYVVPNAVEGGYDNGDKVGGIVGWLGDNGDNRTLTNCSVADSEISAYRDVGGIAGYVASSTNVENNKALDNVSITVDQTTNHYGDKDPNAGAIYGRTGGDITESNNSVTDTVSIDITYNKNGLTLKESGDSDDVVLHLVPASYEEATVEVPEGVTTIGSYAFAYNGNIETIQLPSTVTTLNDRAFRDTSASEVVLNEGLTNISYQAFRNALNVKSVEIPSTVTTISKEAFQNSGVTELVIPDNVTTIEYGGLRDMKELETVTIEGNVDIPVYAFRACTKLKTVILKGDNVTFGGGSSGMIFTNKENGDGSAITVYVANETVKERLLATDTAAKDYGGYKIVVGSPIETAKDLTAALKAGNDVVLGADIELSELVTMKSGVLDGNGHTITMSDNVDNHHALIYADDGAVTIKNVTFDGIKKGAAIRTLNAALTLDNCTFVNCEQNFTQGIVRCNLGNATITNCTFMDNSCSMVVTFNWDAENDTALKVENCLFENNTCADTAVIHYVSGTGCTLKGNSFVNNKVNVSGNNNAATVYLGFNENNVVTNNLFSGNAVKALESTRVRVTGGLMVGHAATVTGNAFISNSIENHNGSDNLGQSVCASVYYSDIDLSGNYWGGGAPVAGTHYYEEYPDSHDVIISSYATSYTVDSDGVGVSVS